MMTVSMFVGTFFLLLSLSVFPCCVSAQDDICTTSAFGVFSLDNLICFTVSDGANFTCGEAGSRVAYQSQDFSIDPVSTGGGNVETAQQSIWTVENATNDVLTLDGCSVTSSPSDFGSCVVVGFLDCNCVDFITAAPCGTTTAAPAPAPTPPASEFPNCPKITPNNEEICGELLLNALPIPDPGCDCYNFCEGVFQSCCTERTGSCGNTICNPSNDMAQPGTIESNVWGCHEGHLLAAQQKQGDDDDDDNGDPNPSGNGTSDARRKMKIHPIILLFMQGMIFVVFTQLFGIMN